MKTTVENSIAKGVRNMNLQTVILSWAQREKKSCVTSEDMAGLVACLIRGLSDLVFAEI
jgi:hypothetical protein